LPVLVLESGVQRTIDLPAPMLGGGSGGRNNSSGSPGGGFVTARAHAQQPSPHSPHHSHAVVEPDDDCIPEAQRVLKTGWGYNGFRAGQVPPALPPPHHFLTCHTSPVLTRATRKLQETAIRAAVCGQDSIVVMATGSGKSLCYQVGRQFLYNSPCTLCILEQAHIQMLARKHTPLTCAARPV